MDVSNENFFQRQGKAFCSCCCGIMLVPIIMGVVFWNENNEVVNYATADVVNKATPVTGCLPQSGDANKLVFAPCNVFAPDIAPKLPDTLQKWLPKYQGSAISWSTEIYGWSETSDKTCTKDNHGGQHCVTTYTCNQGWASSLEGGFKCPQARGNPNSGHDTFPADFPSQTKSVQAEEFQVMMAPAGSRYPPPKGFAMDNNLQGQLPSANLASQISFNQGGSQVYSRTGGALSATMLRNSGGYLTTGSSVGDVRISLTGLSATEATVAAQQVDSSGRLGAHPAEKFGWFGKHTKPLEKLEPGILSQDAFIKLWRSEIAAEAWIIRFITFLVMVVAFEMIVQPLSVSADLLRMLNWCTCCLGTLLDDLAQCVIHTIAFFAATILWVLTFSVAWIVARPLLGLCLLAVDIAIVAACVYFARNRKGARQVAVGDTSSVPAGMGGYPTAADPYGQNMQQQVPIQQQQMAQPLVQASPGMTTMNVTCPDGVGPGGLIGIMSPSGQQCNVTVPPGIFPGQHFNVQVPS